MAADPKSLTLIRRPKSRLVLGLDISTSSVKLVELRKTGSSYRVVRFGVGAMPPNAMSHEVVKDIEAAGEAVRRAWQRSGTRLKHAAISICGAATITKTFNIPAGLGVHECEDQVALAVSNLIPFPLEEVAWDFEIMGPAPDKPDMQEVQLVATRRENVEHRQAVLEIAGLKTEVVDCEIFAVENAFSLVSEEGAVDATEGSTALLDFGATTTTLNVLRGGRLVYTRDESFGGNELTTEIMRRFDLSYQDAGYGKRNGGLPEGYEREVLEPFLNHMAQEAGRALQFYHAASGDDDPIGRVLLCGGCASQEGAVEAIARHLDQPVARVDPLAAMTLAPQAKAQGIEREGPALMVACGLALRSFQ